MSSDDRPEINSQRSETTDGSATSVLGQLLERTRDPEERDLLTAYIGEGSASSILRVAQALAKRVPKDAR